MFYTLKENVMSNTVINMNIYIFARLNKITYQEAIRYIHEVADKKQINNVYQQNFSHVRKTINQEK